MLTRKPRTILVAFILLAASVRNASAQFRDASQPNTRGFFVKFGATSHQLRADSITDGRETALSDALGIGVGFTPHLALVFEGGASFYRHGRADHYRTDYFDVGARWHFPRENHRLVPYADAMISGIFLRKDSASFAASPTGTKLAGQHDIDCGCWTLGGGLLYYITSTFAIDANAHWSSGNFKASTPGAPDLKPNLALPAQAMRLMLGFAFYPDKNFRPRPLFSRDGLSPSRPVP